MAASTCAVFACLAVILACLSVSDGFQAVKGMADGRNFVKSAPSLPRDVLKWSSSPTYTSGDFAVVASGIEVAVVHVPTSECLSRCRCSVPSMPRRPRRQRCALCVLQPLLDVMPA